MTRINLVPPSELADQHLFAEFREIKMVPESLARSIEAIVNHAMKNGHISDPSTFNPVPTLLKKIPAEYTLGTGHVSFFYDKGFYLQQRYAELKDELRLRGVRFNEEALLDPGMVFNRDVCLLKGYVPTPEALALVRARLTQEFEMIVSVLRNVAQAKFSTSGNDDCIFKLDEVRKDGATLYRLKIDGWMLLGKTPEKFFNDLGEAVTTFNSGITAYVNSTIKLTEMLALEL